LNFKAKFYRRISSSYIHT